MKTNLLFVPVILFFSTMCYAQPQGYWKLDTAYAGSPMVPFTIASTLETTFLYKIDPTKNHISISTDFGVSWLPFSPLTNSGFIPLTTKIFFLFRGDSLFKSTDAGSSWQNIFSLHDTTVSVNGFSMWSETSGFLMYIDTQRHYHDMVTHDGGNTFNELGHDSLFRSVLQNNPSQQHPGSFKLFWQDSLNGMLVPVEGSYYRTYNTVIITHNGGRDWHTVRIFSPTGDTAFTINRVNIPHAGTYSFIGLDPKPYFYYSSDYGDHWQTSDTTNMPMNIGDLCSQTTSTAMWSEARQNKTDVSPAPNSVLLYTNDLGKNWNVDRVTFKDYNIGYLRFADSLHGFIAASKIGTDSGYFFRFIAGNSGVAQHGNLSDESTIEIYPNPCNDIIHLKTTKTFETIRIINILGQDVLSSGEPNKSVFDTSRLPNGIYTLECIAKDGIPVRRSFLKIMQ